MKMNALFLFRSVIVCQILLVSCSSSDSDSGTIGATFSWGINLLKHLHRLFPFYPSANQDGSPFKDESYDFIIVGASPSGTVLANRLSENPNWKILLLEAGEEAAFPVKLPLSSGPTIFTEYDWGYRAQSQGMFCRGCTNGNVLWAHGKGLGGSTLTNFMLYVRGNNRDYQKWYEQGNPGWSYEEVLPYFLKSEDAQIANQDESYHKRDGCLKVSDVPFRSKAGSVWIEAVQQAGYPYINDYNGRQQFGVSYVQGTVRYGERWSAERAFLRPIRHRRNLTIRINALATKVLIDGENVAYGVQYIKNGRTRRAFARKEVILSAGSLNSPQILMLSGIGPAAHLRDLGIPVIQDLPVGKQIYDHTTFPAVSFLVNESITVDLGKELTKVDNYKEYIFNCSGPLTMLAGVESLAFIRTPVSKDPYPKYPDVELIFVPGGMATDFGLVYRRIVNIPKAMYNRVWKQLEGKQYFTVSPILVHPESKGFTKLKSRNPRHAPLFYANYFSDPENKDVRTIIAAIRIIQRIVSMPAFQKYDAKILDVPLPGCEHIQFNTDDYWECAIRTIIGSIWDQMGSCKMGPPEDLNAVVDNELKVYGVNNMRVVDASVIPVTLTGHISAAAYMIGEKGADIIKSSWKQ